MYPDTSEENARLIKQEIENLRDSLARHDYKNFWRKVRIVKDMFGKLNSLSKEDKERLWSEYSCLCESAKKEMRECQAESSEASERNTRLIEKELEVLRELHSEQNYKDFWEETDKAKEMFSKLKPLFKEDRERLWSEYSNICEEVKEKMEEDQEIKRSNSTLIKLELIKLQSDHNIRNCLAITISYKYREFWDHAKKVAQMFKDMKLFREDREKLWFEYHTFIFPCSIGQMGSGKIVSG